MIRSASYWQEVFAPRNFETCADFLLDQLSPRPRGSRFDQYDLDQLKAALEGMYYAAITDARVLIQKTFDEAPLQYFTTIDRTPLKHAIELAFAEKFD